MQTATKWKKLLYRGLVANTRQPAVCPVSVHAACSRLQCLCLYYSILQRHRTCAFSPLWAIPRFQIYPFPFPSPTSTSIHLHLHLHRHCIVPPTWFIRCCASISGSENQHQSISRLLVSNAPCRGNNSALTLRPHWIVATCVCMQLVSGNHHHLQDCVSRLAVHSRTG
jgi:hypothetical protein